MQVKKLRKWLKSKVATRQYKAMMLGGVRIDKYEWLLAGMYTDVPDEITKIAHDPVTISIMTCRDVLDAYLEFWDVGFDTTVTKMKFHPADPTQEAPMCYQGYLVTTNDTDTYLIYRNLDVATGYINRYKVKVK